MIKIDIAKGACKCRTCGKKIGKGEGRVKQPSGKYGATYKYHHLKCYLNFCKYQSKLWQEDAAKIEEKQDLLKKEHEMMVVRAI